MQGLGEQCTGARRSPRARDGAQLAQRCDKAGKGAHRHHKSKGAGKQRVSDDLAGGELLTQHRRNLPRKGRCLPRRGKRTVSKSQFLLSCALLYHLFTSIRAAARPGKDAGWPLTWSCGGAGRPPWPPPNAAGRWAARLRRCGVAKPAGRREGDKGRWRLAGCWVAAMRAEPSWACLWAHEVLSSSPPPHQVVASLQSWRAGSRQQSRGEVAIHTYRPASASRAQQATLGASRAPAGSHRVAPARARPASAH